MFTLRLIVDEEKHKVVLAEASKDFIDVLFSLLTLPMGTIVKLLENHPTRKTVTVGCFSNLHRSVMNMGSDNFQTTDCKQMLLYSRGVRDVQCKRLKLNLHPTEGVKCYKCQRENYSTALCHCGALETQLSETLVACQKDVNERSAFILTDDLKVEVKSTEVVLNKLKSLGFADVSKLGVRFLSIGLEEVLSLLESILSSNAPLTHTFLNKKSTQGELLSPCMEKHGDEAEHDNVFTMKAFLKKEDKKILFVECGEDFVELLVSFLAIPLESVGAIFGEDFTLGCIGNLWRSFKNFSDDKKTDDLISKGVLHHFYDFQTQMAGVITQQPSVYYRYNLGLTNPNPHCQKYSIVPVVLIDPKSRGSNESTPTGFLKKGTKFTVLDDLTIASMNSYSTVSLLKKVKSRADDFDVQVITISRTEALNLLRASFVTSSALNMVLCHLIAKEPKM